MSETDPYAKYRQSAPLELPQVEVSPDEPPPQQGPMQPVLPQPPAASPYGRYQQQAPAQMVQPGVITKAPVGPIGQGPDPVHVPDKYDAAAEEEEKNLDRIGGSAGRRGYIDRLVKGAGAGWTDDFMAAGAVPFEMIKRDEFNPAEAYRYTRAREQRATERIQKETEGPLGAAAEVAGGVLTGGQVLASGPRIGRTVNALGQQISPAVANYLANVGKGGLVGAFAGAGEAPRGKDMAQGALGGGLIGGVVGGAVQPAAALVHGAGNATIRLTQAQRMRDPNNIATEEFEKAMRASGQTMAQVVQKVKDAHAAGQTDYTAMDAIGEEAFKKVTVLNKFPGETRNDITKFLAGRNEDRGIRTSHEIRKALDAPGSADLAIERLQARAKAEAGPYYDRAMEKTTWNEQIDKMLKDPIAAGGLKAGIEQQRLRTVGSNKEFNPTDAMITEFGPAGDPVITGVPNMQTLHTLKVGLDRMIDGERNAFGKLNQRGSALLDYQKRLLSHIDDLNPDYAQARRVYAGPMKVAETVEKGQSFPRGGLAEDTLREYHGQSPNEQAGTRIGVADTVRDQLERANYPRYLQANNYKGRTELDEFSQYQGPRQLDPKTGKPKGDQLRQFLTREEEMQAATKAATGGSDTAEKLAGMAQTPGASEIVNAAAGAASGNPLTITQSLLNLAQKYGRGESEAQRNAIAKALLAREPDALQAIADRLAKYDQARRGVNPNAGTWRIPPGQ